MSDAPKKGKASKKNPIVVKVSKQKPIEVTDSNQNPIGVKASNQNPIVVLGFPGTTQPLKEYVVAFGYGYSNDPKKNLAVTDLISKTVGHFEAEECRTIENEAVHGFLLLKFRDVLAAKKTEDQFGGQKVLGRSTPLSVRDFESRGEVYQGCRIDGNELILLTMVKDRYGATEEREVRFGGGKRTT